jgi:hypothetical protein
MVRLTEMLTVRITPRLKFAIEAYAHRMKLRTADVVRFLLADALEGLSRKTENSPRIEDEKNASE